MKGRALLCLVATVALMTASCARSSNEKSAESESNGSNTSQSSGAGASLLAQGGFGDLKNVCQNGNAKGATDTGVTDTEIHIGTVTDKGSTIRPNLNIEMADTAKAFAKWCNEKGGILGRKLVVDDLDAALFNYGQAISTACPVDFSLVGGGAVFDDGDNGQRVQCGLPNIAGYVVTSTARSAQLQVQPLPNPVNQLQVGGFKLMDGVAPGSLQHVGVMTGAIQTTQQVRDDHLKALPMIGGKVVYSADYNPQGETNWTPFVDDLKRNGVQMLDFIGEPVNLQSLQSAMATAGYTPSVTILTANFYDSKYAQEGGANAKNTYVATSFYPFIPEELAKGNQATQDFVDLMKQYNPSGKIAFLGVQGLSAYLLFAQAATACGSNLTRQCLLDKAKVNNWTGGGLHAPTNPGTNTGATCITLMKVDGTSFVNDTAATHPNNGIFNCDPSNGVVLQ